MRFGSEHLSTADFIEGLLPQSPCEFDAMVAKPPSRLEIHEPEQPSYLLEIPGQPEHPSCSPVSLARVNIVD